MENQENKNEELHKEQKEYSYKEEQRVFAEKFKVMLMDLLTPVVHGLVCHIRLLEIEEKGKGQAEIDKLLLVGDINQPMYNILFESIQDLSKDYDVKLEADKYLKSTKLD